jgi:hypothetical protein
MSMSLGLLMVVQPRRGGTFVLGGSRRGRPLLGDGIAHGEDRAGGSPDDFVNDVVEEPATQPGPPVSAHDDEAALNLIRHAQDHGSRVPLLDPSVDGDVGGNLVEAG